MLKFFKRKEKEIELPKWYNGWINLKKDFPIGRKFEYLGVTLMVVCYQEFTPSTRVSPIILPKIICHYSDAFGGLFVIKFGHETWEVLFKEAK